MSTLQPMKVTIRIGGSYIYIQETKEPLGYGYATAAFVGGVRLTQRRKFYISGSPPPATEPLVAERIVPNGTINFYVQKECEQDHHYEYCSSEYMAKYWPIKCNDTDEPGKGNWNQMRSLNYELKKYYEQQGKDYVPPPTLFTGFNVFAFFNYGTFSADTERPPVTGTNMTTEQVIVKPRARVDFDVPGDEYLVVGLAVPRFDGSEVVMHREEWVNLESRGLIDRLEIGIEPLNPYATLPVLGYEGMVDPPPDEPGEPRNG